MERTQSKMLLNPVDYYELPNGFADVYLRKNIAESINEEDEQTVYEADEVYFRISGVSKEEIEANFDYFWEDAEKVKPPEPTEIEKLRLETAQTNAEMFEMMLMMSGGGL